MKKAILIIGVLLFFSPLVTFAAIARDANSGPIQSASAGNSVSCTVTTGSASTLLLLLIHDQGGSTPALSSVQANGTNMTQWSQFQDTNNNRVSYVYALVSPSVNTSYTMTATRTDTSFRILCNGLAYSGTSLTNSPDATQTKLQTGSPSGISLSITTVKDNAWIVSVADEGTPNTGGTNCTSLGTQLQDEFFCDSNGPITPAGITTVSNSGANTDAGLLSVSFAPATSVKKSSFNFWHFF